VNGSKRLLESKTFWGAVITLVASGLLVFGVAVTPEEQEAAGNAVLRIVGGVGEIVGFVVVIIGRIKAEKRIGQ